MNDTVSLLLLLFFCYIYLFIYLLKWNNWIDLQVTDVIQLPAQGQVWKLYMSKSHTISHRNKG